MRPYGYVAYTPEGRRRRGVVVAESETEASEQIGARGLLPAEIVPRGGGAAPALRRRGFARRIDRDMLAVFTRQMAVLLSAGLAADAALDAVQSSASAPSIEALAAEGKAGLMQGDALSEALGRGRELPPYYLAAVRAGEHSGELAAVFETLAEHLETSSAERAQMASALIYPAFVTVVALLVCGVLMVTVAPEIVAMFEAAGQELPALTQAMLAAVAVIERHWPLILGALAGLVLFGLASGRVPALRARRDRVLLAVPLTRRFMRMAAAAQYLRTLALVINARLPLDAALRHAAAVLSVGPFRAEAEAAGEALRRGESLGRALGRVSFLHPVSRQLVEAGEASARVGPMTERAAVLAESWMRTERKRIAVLLEPLSMVIVGGLVLVIVLAILLPICDMQAMVQG